jgi:acid phosphatase
LINPRVRIIVPAALASLLALTALPAAGASPARAALGNINHIVVIYQENHSFDNLYGSWERVNGLSRADSSSTIQIGQGGVPYTCLKQNDVNLVAPPPPPPPTCTDTTTGTAFSSNFTNQPFNIDDFIKSTDTTCPAPGAFYPNGVAKGSGLPGGCTEDLVHRYYQEQYQLNGGLQNRYVTGSDAIGLTMGVYKTADLPIYQYLHQAGHPQYAISDKFFQGAFGGSFLNHQWLIAAAAPIFAGAAKDASPIVASNPHPDMHSVVDANGMPNNYPLYTSLLGPNGSSTDPTKNPTGPRDNQLTASCSPPAPRPATPSNVVCGDFAVNTTQPWYQPYAPGTKDGRRLPPLTSNNIGDELSTAGVDWAWYAGGWSNADGRVGDPGWSASNGPTACNAAITAINATYPFCPDPLFQFHHQAFNYFDNYGRLPDTSGKTAAGAEKPARVQHLRDEQEFLGLASHSATQCQLKPVSFVKPIGSDNEHPGYTSESAGSSHLVDLIKAIEGSACKNDTLVVSTYDEFGGQWDHVTPPGQGGNGGVADQWGPGTRIPALVISPNLNGDFVVDHVPHDTTSILATIEHRFGLAPLGTRDAAVRDLSSVYNAR